MVQLYSGWAFGPECLSIELSVIVVSGRKTEQRRWGYQYCCHLFDPSHYSYPIYLLRPSCHISLFWLKSSQDPAPQHFHKPNYIDKARPQVTYSQVCTSFFQLTWIALTDSRTWTYFTTLLLAGSWSRIPLQLKAEHSRHQQGYWRRQQKVKIGLYQIQLTMMPCSGLTTPTTTVLCDVRRGQNLAQTPHGQSPPPLRSRGLPVTHPVLSRPRTGTTRDLKGLLRHTTPTPLPTSATGCTHQARSIVATTQKTTATPLSLDPWLPTATTVRGRALWTLHIGILMPGSQSYQSNQTPAGRPKMLCRCSFRSRSSPTPSTTTVTSRQ